MDGEERAIKWEYYEGSKIQGGRMLSHYKPSSWPTPKCPNSLPYALSCSNSDALFSFRLRHSLFLGGQLSPMWVPYVSTAQRII